MTREEPSGPAPDALQALDRMQAALRILDEIEAPGDIGSHLDLAIARLRDRFGLGAETNPWALARSGRIEPAPADPEAGLPDAPDRAILPPL